MKVILELGHPADVHVFKYVNRELLKKGHTILAAVREKGGIVSTLCQFYNFKYEVFGNSKQGLIKKVASIFSKEINLLKLASKFKPDVFLSGALGYCGPVSRVLRKSYITYDDTEPVRAQAIQHYLFIPYPNVILTPEKYYIDLGRRHLRIKFFKETAYLHPNWFKPDSSVLEQLGVSKDEKYVILRLSSFDASHDVGITGFSLDQKRLLVKRLEEHGRVFISSEGALPNDLKNREFSAPPEKLHDALFYATMVVAETGTITTESAILGTPVVHSSTRVKYGGFSNLDELEHDYGLIYNIADSGKAIEKALELIQTPSLKQTWQTKREKLFRDKIDFTSFLIWFIENYPESKTTIKENPNYQEKFK